MSITHVAHTPFLKTCRIVSRGIILLGLASLPGWPARGASAPQSAPPMTVNLTLNTTAIRVDEGGTATFQIGLDAKPVSNVTLSVKRLSGDSDLTVSSGTTVTIPRATWTTPATVAIRAAEDADKTNGVATIQVSETSGNGIAAKTLQATEADNDNGHFLIDVDNLPVPEGSSRVLRVWLDSRPTTGVTFTVTPVTGSDADLTVAGGSPGLIPAASWSTPVSVTIAAAADADKVNGTGTFRIHATNYTLPDQTFSVRELDSDPTAVCNVGGTISGNVTWTTTTKDLVINSQVVVPAGSTLTIGPGVTVRQGASNFRAFDVSGTLRVQNGARLLLYTYTPYNWNTGDRKNSITVENGGACTFDRVLFQVMETNDPALWGPDDNDQIYWAAVVYALDGGQVTARGCRFEGLGRSDGWVPPYGLRLEAGARADVTDSTSTKPSTRTWWRNLRAGVGWVAGTAHKRVDLGNFQNCTAGTIVWGNVQSEMTLVNPDNKVASHNGSSLTVKSGQVLTVASGAGLRSAADRWVYVENGGRLVMNHAQATMASPIQVNGRLEATDSSIQCLTHTPYNWETGNRRNGIIVGDNGRAVFERVRFAPVENNDPSNYGVDNNEQVYWAAALYLTGSSSSTVHGCQFVNQSGTNGWKTPTGIRIDPTASVAVENSTTTSPAVRNGFNGFQAGIEWQAGTGTQRIANSDFSSCGRNIRLWGTASTDITLNNTNVVLGTHSGSSLTIKSGAKMVLNAGSEFITRSGKQVTVESGGRLTATKATINTYGHIQSAGVLSLTSTTMITQTYAPYNWEPGNRQNGLVVLNGGSATLKYCSLYFSEAGDHPYWPAGDSNRVEWAAMIQAQAGSAFAIDRCAFNQAPSPAGFFSSFGVRTETKVNWTLTNCVFARNYAGLGIFDMPATATFSGSEFRDAEAYAIYNNTSTVLNAPDCYWGNASGPAHVTNPGGTGARVTNNVNFDGARISPSLTMVQILPPSAGQETDALGSGASVLGAELFGVRVLPARARVDQIAFRLTNKTSSMAWSKIVNYRLALDANGDGTIGASETALAGGTATVTDDGNDRVITFSQSFTAPSTGSTNYILLADLDNLATGDAFTALLDARALRTKLTAGIDALVGTVRHYAGTGVLLADPRLGQVQDNLNGLPEQNDVELFGFRLLGTGSSVERIDFQLSGVQDISALKLASVRLYEDTNTNNVYDSGERLVASVPTAVSFNTSNATGVITFALTKTTDMPTGRSYLLVANLRNLNGGDALTVSLGTGNVDLTGSATLADGWTTAASHVADSPVLLASSTHWAPPANFGATAKSIPLLGFQIIPSGRAIKSLKIGLSSVYGISASDITNLRLYWDRNSSGVVDSGDTLLASGGTIAIGGGSGTIGFGSFSSRGNLIVQADIANLTTGDELTSTLTRDGIAIAAGWQVCGSAPAVRLVVGKGPEEGTNKNMKWTLTWRSPGGQSVSGRFNHAGNRVILGYDTGSAWVYDSSTNTPLIMLKDHYDKVRYAGFSSDDSAAVTVSRDGAVYIWDLSTSGTLRSAMFSDLLVEYAVPSPNFRKLMIITQGKGMLLDLDTQQRLWEFTPGDATVNAIAYSPDGTQILLGSSDKRAYLLNASTGNELARLTGHSQGVTGVAFTGDGKTLMTASSDATVQLWTYNTTLKRWMVSRSITLSNQSAQAAAVSNNGQRVCMVTGGGDSALLRMFDGTTRLQLYEINLNNVSQGNWGGTTQNVAFDDTGARVLVNSSGKGWGQTACFRVSDGAYLNSWGPQGNIPGDFEMRPRASMDGSRIFYNTNWGMNLLFRETGKTIRLSPNMPGNYRYAIDGNGTRLTWVQESRLRVDAVSDGGFSTVVNQGFDNWNNVPVSMRRDGTQFAVGDRLYSGIDGSLVADSADNNGGYPSAFSTDSTFWGYALSGSKAMVTLLTDDPNATQYNMMLTDPYTPFKLFYHPDGIRIGCVDRSTGVQMYDMDQDLPVGLYRFDAGDVYDATLSDDGSLMLIGGNNVVKLYDVNTGSVLRYFYPQHSSLTDVAVRSVQFAKNDTQIVIGWSYNYVEIYERSQAKKLDVTPAARKLARGQSQAFQVEIVYDDTTRRDITPRVGQQDTSVSLEVIPAAAATVTNNTIKVAAAASGSFTVRARYREDGQTLVGEATVTVGTAKLVDLQASPDKMVLTPGVFRPITYTATYDDGYQTEVTEDVTLAADRAEDVEISGQNVKVLYTAQPGQIVVTGTYEDPWGGTITAQTVILMFGPRTEWERYAVTGGGYGAAGAFSPNGLQMAVGSSSGAVNLYSVPSGATPTQYTLTHIIRAHESPLVLVDYLDGANDQIVSVAQDGTIKTWSASTPTSQPLSLYQYDAQIQCAALRCESGQRYLALGDSLGRVAVIDLVAGQARWKLSAHTGATQSVAIDGDTVLSGGADGRLRVFVRETGQISATKTVHTKAIVSVGFMTVNGAAGFYTLSEDNTLVRWAKSNLTITGKPYEFSSAPTAAAVIGDQLYVATSSPPATWLFNSNGLLLRWLEHAPAEGKITKIMVSPGGSYIVTGRSTGKKSVALKLMGMDAGTVEAISSFCSFQFWESGRGIYRGSLAHSFPMIQAHAASDGLTVYTQDPKRTMSWLLSNDTIATGTRLMETGYFIDPHFTGMDFNSNSSLLATRVGVSIFMYDTVHNLLWKTLHTPGEGPFKLSPANTRLATADSKTRLWDLANLSMIDENPHLCSGMGFVGETTFLGAIEADRFLGIFDSRNIMVNGATTRHMPQKIHVNRKGDRAIVISYEVRGGGMFEPKTYDYYAETYNIANLANEPQILNEIYLFTIVEDPFAAQTALPAFSIAVSEDAALALVGASGDRPVKLIQLADGSTIREFLPPTGRGDGNIGAASVEFLSGDRGVMIGWGEGYAELWRRVLPLSLSLSVNGTAVTSKPALEAPGALNATSTRIKVMPGQTLRLQVAANYRNSETLNVTPSATFTSSAPSVVFCDGSLITVSPQATAQVVSITVKYVELGQTLTATVQLEIVGTALKITGLNKTAYTIDLLAAGKALYNDAKATFTLPIPSGLLHQQYIRTRAADGNATGNGFIQFTVNQPVRVIVAVDANMTKLPAWLAGWTELGTTLTTTDTPAKRRLFQNYFNQGLVSLGANRDTNGPMGLRMYNAIIASPTPGKIGAIAVAPAMKTAGWRLSGPYNVKFEDQGTSTIPNMPIGTYTITWLPVSNWDLPVPAEASGALSASGLLTLSGAYARHTGSVAIYALPATATWRFTDADGVVTNGQGSKILPSAATGNVKLLWNALSGYTTPSPQTQTRALTKGNQVAFTGIYLAQSDSVDSNRSKLLMYLLGLAAQESWMDANKDGKVNIADSLYLRDYGTPLAPAVVTPANNATGVATTVTFDWTDAKYAKTYDFYLWKSGASQPATPTVSGLTVSKYKPAQALTAATTYYWRVKAKSLGASTWSVPWSFKTK